MRVSKADGSQVLDLQRDALLAVGVPSDRFYEDHASGKRDDRPGMECCLKSLRKGDTLVAWKLDRIGRDLRHLVNLVHDLTIRGVGLRVLAGEGAAIDTTTANGRLMFGFFAALAEFERELIVERTKAGLAAARARGRRGGRPFKMTAAKLNSLQAGGSAEGAAVKGGHRWRNRRANTRLRSSLGRTFVMFSKTCTGTFDCPNFPFARLGLLASLQLPSPAMRNRSSFNKLKSGKRKSMSRSIKRRSQGPPLRAGYID